MTNRELAAFIAREIFSVGSDVFNNNKAQRIQFMFGTYPDEKTEHVGLNEEALARVIYQTLEEFDGMKQIAETIT